MHTSAYFKNKGTNCMCGHCEGEHNLEDADESDDDDEAKPLRKGQLGLINSNSMLIETYYPKNFHQIYQMTVFRLNQHIFSND